MCCKRDTNCICSQHWHQTCISVCAVSPFGTIFAHLLLSPGFSRLPLALIDATNNLNNAQANNVQTSCTTVCACVHATPWQSFEGVDDCESGKSLSGCNSMMLLQSTSNKRRRTSTT